MPEEPGGRRDDEVACERRAALGDEEQVRVAPGTVYVKETRRQADGVREPAREAGATREPDECAVVARLREQPGAGELGRSLRDPH